MKNTFGNSLSVTLFGESHGEAVGAVIDGLAPGIEINEEFIASQLDLRRPAGKISTARHEGDKVRILSGVFHSKATGTPLALIIENENTKSADYEKTRYLARPSHADYTAQVKYRGYQDYRGGGHFSGRITAPLVAAGAVAIDMLRKKGVYIATHIKNLHGVCDRDFDNLKSDIDYLNSIPYAVLDENAKEKMIAETEKAAAQGDSVGGTLETAVIGLESGLGEPWFDSIESQLSHILFSVPAVKGVEFGAGFGFSNMTGSEANDSFYVENSKVKTYTNNNGGINGGITNGMPVIFRCAVKPTPSIFKEQKTIDMNTMENAVLSLKGRHDPAVIHRARVVIDSVTALCIADMLTARHGADWFGGE